MKAYTITIPAFEMVVVAKNTKEALEQFWFDYDIVQDDPDWNRPIVKVMDKNGDARRQKISANY